MEGNIPAAELVVKHFATAYLFTININSVNLSKGQNRRRQSN